MGDEADWSIAQRTGHGEAPCIGRGRAQPITLCCGTSVLLPTSIASVSLLTSWLFISLTLALASTGWTSTESATEKARGGKHGGCG